MPQLSNKNDGQFGVNLDRLQSRHEAARDRLSISDLMILSSVPWWGWC